MSWPTDTLGLNNKFEKIMNYFIISARNSLRITMAILSDDLVSFK